MSLTLSKKTEARLVTQAQEQGLSIDAFLDRLMNECDLKAGTVNGGVPELPVWHLGATGSLRRRDIYDDVS